MPDVHVSDRQTLDGVAVPAGRALHCTSCRLRGPVWVLVVFAIESQIDFDSNVTL